MSKLYDVAILGAGPGGMSAALELANRNLSIVVLDRKATPGGQIYRDVSNSPLQDTSALGKEYEDGAELVRSFEAANIERIQGADVWHVGEDGTILFSLDGQTKSLGAKEIILSPGAMERPFPIPGWQLPGVMSAGSAQVMLKSDGLVKDGAIFAGCGPLLYLIVAQYIRLGVSVKALVDTTQAGSYLKASRLVGGALAKRSYIAKGLSLIAEIKRAGIPIHKGAKDLRILGKDKAQGVSFLRKGKNITLDADHVFLHQGVLPNLNMTKALGLEHHWSKTQLCWTPTLDQWSQSSIPHIAVVGDAAGILGADAARATGRVAARKVLCNLGLLSREELENTSRADLSEIKDQQKFRAFLDVLYEPYEGHRIPEDPDCLVCRCEEQTVAQLREGFEQGAQDPNALKSQTRCGMGPCQGRQCGHTVSELLAKWRYESVEEVGYYRLRSPQRLLSIEEFSQFQSLAPQKASINGGRS
jgi:thioredoxin reductase